MRKHSRIGLFQLASIILKMKKTSFLIPAYNHQDYIVATLESIYRDDYPCKQIVVIDDGSTDNTASIIRHWIDQHSDIEVNFASRKNKGITATLNELIGSADGDYLRLFSSDDIVLPGTTAEMAKCLDANPSISAVFSDVAVIGPDGALVGDSALEMNGADIKNYLNQDLLRKEIVANWAVSGPAILIRKKWYLENGLYDEDMLIDDWDLYLRLAAADSIAFLGLKSAQYRRHDLNTCRTHVVEKRILNLQSQLKAADRNLGLFSGRLKTLLRAERALLLSKINFLSRSYHKSIGYLLYYFLTSVRGRL